MTTPSSKMEGQGSSLYGTKSKIRALLVLMCFLLGPLALIFGFYGEENLRGAWLLFTTKAKWVAQGETFDLKAFIPPAIPDDQNLGALPIFQLSPDAKFGGMAMVTLRNDLQAPGDFFYSPSMWSSKGIDVNAERKKISKCYLLKFPKKIPTNELEELDEMFPVWQTILNSSSTRKQCRFNIDYETIPFAKRDSLKLCASIITLGGMAFKHGILAIDDHLPDLASEDIRVLFELATGEKEDSSLIDLLAGETDEHVCINLILFGIGRHRWSDTQLLSFQDQLTSIHALTDFQKGCRGDLVISSLPMVQSLKADRSEKELSFLENDLFLFPYWPSGWIDCASAFNIDCYLIQANAVLPEKHLIDMAAMRNLERRSERKAHGWLTRTPWNALTEPPMMIQIGSRFQTLLDQAVIACALERYHLVHHAYPADLAELSPFCPKPIPHDVIGGKPYVYKLNADGTFILYSIGWNEVDDGGMASTDREKGDWVWPGHG